MVWFFPIIMGLFFGSAVAAIMRLKTLSIYWVFPLLVGIFASCATILAIDPWHININGVRTRVYNTEYREYIITMHQRGQKDSTIIVKVKN
jgi:hypothetical protein